jgi:hypothetical protein
MNEQGETYSVLLLILKYRPTQRAPDPSTGSGTAGGTLRVFRQFVWRGVGSVKMALSHPTHQYP